MGYERVLLSIDVGRNYIYILLGPSFLVILLLHCYDVIRTGFLNFFNIWCISHPLKEIGLPSP